jgi:hypothetical protein
MSRLITAKIDVKKIDKAKLFKGEKGTYLNLTIWINDNPDQFGNDISIQQYTKLGEDKIFLGGGKFYVKKDPEVKPEIKEEKNSPALTGPVSTVRDIPPVKDELDDLPF